MSKQPTHSRLLPQERQEQIIEIATEEISHYGFWGFSTNAVAERLGLTGPAVLYHFKSKLGLLIAVLEHRDTVDRRIVADLLHVPVEKLWEEPLAFGSRELTRAVMQRNAEQFEIIRLFMILQAEALSPNHPAHDFFQRREMRTLTNFAKLARHDGVADPRREAVDMLAAIEGIQLRWLHDPETIDLCEEWESFAEHRWGSRNPGE